MVFPYMTHLLAAMLLGALIGAERQWRQRMAGLRTNALAGHRRGGVYSQRDVGLAGQPGAYCSADRLRYRLPWGRGDYA